MAELSLDNIINVSVSAAQSGAGEYNTSNLAVFTAEPYGAGFGALGYKIYLGPTEVATDFGSTSDCYAMANGVFSQQPNILAGNGYLVVIPLIVEVQTLSFLGVAASGTFVLNFDGDATAAINWDDTASQIQVKVRTLAGLEDAVVTGSIASLLVTITFNGYSGNAAITTISANSLQTVGLTAVTVTPAQLTAGETFAAAVTRTVGLVQYFGLMTTSVLDQTATLAVAAVVQALLKIVFLVQRNSASVNSGGILDLLTTGGFSRSRGLYYGEDTDQEALVMQASYAGRALSTNFEGSNTTSTMHLKDLIGVQPDPSMTETLLNLCQDAGADVYASFQGVSKVFTSGENSFFDQVYNLIAYLGDLQIAAFNYLAQSSTKVPQTENGMDGFKGSQRKVCEQYVSNQYLAPGVWNSSTTFGNQSDFLANIKQVGYYIYSAPIAKQSQTQREARIAPLCQIAAKEAGAIQSANIIIYINA